MSWTANDFTNEHRRKLEYGVIGVEYPATYAAMQTSITADSTTKRDFFVTADETNGYQLTKYSYDGTSTTRESKSFVQNNSYKEACLLGDSLMGQHASMTGGTPTQGAQGFLNWGNWLLGAPFNFTQNLGVSGDGSDNIFSRLWQIHSHIDTVFVLAGTNDINSFSSASNSTQITAKIDQLIGASGYFTLGLAALKSAGKKVCISTIPPNNGWSTSSDARIQVLDAVNQWILASKTAGRVDEVIDLFTACWDSTLSTTRVFITNYSSDGTHLTNKGGFAGGQAAKSAIQAMYLKSESVSNKYFHRQNQLSLIGQMRTISGVGSTISNGSGTLASGWRCIAQGSGTPTIVLDNSTSYTIGSDYIGPMSKIVGVNEKWQKLSITNAVAGTVVQLQLNSALAANQNPGCAYGDDFFVGCDVLVANPVGLKSIKIEGSVFFTAGTSPADQPYGSSLNTCRTTAGVSSVAATDYSLQSGFRAHFISEPVRVPQNVNGTAAASGQMYLIVNFDASGSADVYFSRPQFWRKFY